ncbi:MAG: hypothetical protein IH855_06175 [Bacteroidetes bacterium]|nr:hypothetical protein [Bacteroidota bacterium]MCH8030603.1 hypothetical protein [Bacteroidota bacterium]
MIKTVFKILSVVILAFATVALFASPDGPDIMADFDREIFSGFSIMLVAAVWLAVLFGLFRRKKVKG